MIPISDIGFVGHCHYAYTVNGCVPVEVSLVTLRETINPHASPSTYPESSLQPRTVGPTDGFLKTYQNSSFPTGDTTV
ncbi:hypothetical protein CEXT_662151 [Caerostris extrusa]|uniref:Uncharacterized protein n=1 Tax=Caerostris extrusa TaxID=172846 RepID=A0AAV4WMY0_CAEEX|nr:hypothetical protein CEXT_662151 [Caerostris extrusa]